uniref:Uncharacterized protein n=1 Tax=uncultured prokaryote TaxID=198431 RepID=A0A0H5Q2Z5_9ZZZZ|nr:hypothetical protein [uncultured prokaryote]
MAKIAGRKNDGAWYRTNSDLLNLSGPETAKLVQLIEALESLGGAYTVVKNYMTLTGVVDGDFPASSTAWATQLAVGVPRQIWFGVTTYDYYTKGDGVYDKLMQNIIFLLSKDLRKLLKQFIFATRETLGLAKLGGENENQAARAAFRAMSLKQRRETKLATLPEIIELRKQLPPLPAEYLALTNSATKSKGTALRARTLQPKGRGTTAAVTA